MTVTEVDTVKKGDFGPMLCLTINDDYDVYLTGYLLKIFSNVFKEKGSVIFQYMGMNTGKTGHKYHRVILAKQ